MTFEVREPDGKWQKILRIVKGRERILCEDEGFVELQIAFTSRTTMQKDMAAKSCHEDQKSLEIVRLRLSERCSDSKLPRLAMWSLQNDAIGWFAQFRALAMSKLADL